MSVCVTARSGRATDEESSFPCISFLHLGLSCHGAGHILRRLCRPAVPKTVAVLQVSNLDTQRHTHPKPFLILLSQAEARAHSTKSLLNYRRGLRCLTVTRTLDTRGCFSWSGNLRHKSVRVYNAMTSTDFFFHLFYNRSILSSSGGNKKSSTFAIFHEWH